LALARLIGSRSDESHQRAAASFSLETTAAAEQNGRSPQSLGFVEAEDVETEANVLVALLAVRALGGRSAPAGHEVVKALKKPIQQAVAQGLLKEETHTQDVPVAGKKPKKVKTKMVELTEAGEGALRASANPEVLAATQARALAAQVEALGRNLDADRDALKQQVQAALSASAKGKDAGKLSQEVAKLAKSLETLTEKVRKLEEKVPKESGGADTLAAKIDEGFAALRAQLDQALRGLPKPAAPPDRPAPAPRAAGPTERPAPGPSEPESLRGVLRKAYETLCCFREFQEGMVELPRLYHEAKRIRPALSVEEFQREILAVESQHVADLHIRNEVRDASEPEKAIRRNDKLYYYIYWPRP
jgi:hypothetical protein